MECIWPCPSRCHWLAAGRKGTNGGVRHVYNAATVWVYVRVDGGAERQTTGACDPTTCSFTVKLLPGMHRLDIAVRGENNRQRSTDSSVSVTVP
jgi:hypothetical protein